MARKAPRLGKGLEALLGGVDETDESEGVKEIGLDEIRPNSFQPRRSFTEDKLRELADSIRVHGVVQPIIVRKTGEGYELVAGERRWRAAKMAGLNGIRAIVGDFEEHEMLEIALVENLQREDLNPMEQARAYQSLQEEVGLTQAEVAERIGVSRPQVANVLRLLRLPDEVQEMVREGKLGLGHAKVILGLEEEDRVQFALGVVEAGMTVRQAERAVESRKKGSEGAEGKPKSQEEAGQDDSVLFVRDVEQQIGRALGTRVSLRDRGGRGRIVVEYFDYEDLERIIEVIVDGRK
ncbi:MAG: ParB/RepB/Spo0J family partition protein [Bacillota bacterium]